MQTIPCSFKQASQTLHLIRREGNVAMYNTKSGDYWEVHKVRVAPAEQIFGRDMPEREVLAGNSDFGKLAWACTSAARAEARFADA